jgi:hypothetical protein
MVDRTDPFFHLCFCSHLQQVVTAIFSIELDRIGALKVHEGHPCVNNAENQRRLARGSEIQLGSSTLGCMDINDMVQSECVRYRPHQLLEESRRCTLLHPVLSLRRGVSGVHRFGKIFLSLVNPILLLLSLFLETVTKTTIAFVLFVLSYNEPLEWSLATFRLMSRIHVGSFSVSIFSNRTPVELNLVNFSLNGVQALQITSFELASLHIAPSRHQRQRIED